MALIQTTAEQYISQAEDNWAFLSFITLHRPMQYNWMITVQYYFILSLIKAHLTDTGIQAGYHSEVKEAIDRFRTKDPFLLHPVGRNFKTGSSITLKAKYLKLEEYSRRARYLGIDGYYQPVTAHTLMTTIRETDALLAHFLRHHPKINQAPFNALLSLQPIALVLPNVPAWQSASGLLSIK
jgi:hypothetical protein